MKSKVKELAEERGMTLYRVALDSGLTPNALYKWERMGIDKAQLGAVAKVAATLGCSVDDLFVS